MILDIGSATHPGLVRPNNEDALGWHIPEDPDVLAQKGALFAVADGVGGAAAGEIASREAVSALLAEYYSPRASHRVEPALQQAVQAANLRVFNLAHGADPSLRGMQTTLTAVALSGPTAYLAHAGDSRAYLLRGDTLTQVTGDHSEAAELVRLRLITAEQARDHPRRSVLTRTVGGQLLMRPDFLRIPIQAGDRFLLCTDGLWGELEAATLQAVAAGDPEAACRELVQLACEHGGGDNVSVHLVHVIEPGRAAPAPPGRIARLLAGLRGG